MPGKIAILGGSFNPPHSGHLALASLICDQYALDTLFFVPAARHPFEKESITLSFEHRCSMVEAAIEDHPKCVLWSGEGDIAGKSYSSITVKKICREYNPEKCYFIIGSDNLAAFDRWHRYEDIRAASTLLVVHRPGHPPSPPESLAGADIEYPPSPHWGLSSTLLRRYLKHNLSCSYLIPPSVLTYIQKNNLYQE
ncbi:MAG: nicotinate (nicotinamide) nucleotide adenylyltransferase [Fibrobacterota bacterium]